MRSMFWVAAVAGLAFALPAVASADADSSPRIIGAFGFGGGGNADFDGPGFDGPAFGNGRYDLDSTLGLNARFEMPLWKYVSLGAWLEWSAFSRDHAFGDDRDHFFDFDPYVRGRYNYRIRQGLDVEFSLSLPLGFTVGSFDEIDETFFGFNLGALGGATLWLKDRFGVMFEAGVRHHHVFEGDRDIDVTMTQFRAYLGAAMLL